MTTPQRKYHTAAGLSLTSEQRLQQLEQRFEQLDAELSAVESAIEQRFPALGLTKQDSFEAPATSPPHFPKRSTRTKAKPR